MENNEVSIIIPAYNEEDVLQSFIENLKSNLADIDIRYEVIVIDDGSSDNTFSIARNIPDVKVIKHPYNKGNGAAVKTGIFKAAGEKLIIIDADGQHDPKHLIEMIALLDDFDLIVGSRESFGTGRRGLGNVIVSKLASYLSGIVIPDLTSGYRAFKKGKMLEFIDILPNGYSLPSTSTLAFATSGYNIKFIPITAHIRQGGKSNINVSKDGVKFLVLILRMISLFKPLKIFVPLSLFLLMFGLLWSSRTYILTETISSLGAMILMSGIFTFLFGLVADHMAETRLSIGRIKKLILDKEHKRKD